MKSWLACSAHCDFRTHVTDVTYLCPSCGGLLEVRHDVDSLRKTSAHEWKALFARRAAAARLPWASGVWGKKEWVLPELPEEHVVTMGEGRQPLLPLPKMAGELGLESLDLKQCGVSPTGSFKDLGMTVLVSAVKWMRALGKPIRAVACASTGDTSAALAAYCAVAQIPSVVFLPRNKVSLAQLIQPIANGAIVLSLDTDFDGCMRVVKALTKDDSLYLANSMNSLRLEGQKMVAVELAEQFDWDVPDWVVIPGGNLGNASALGLGFEMLWELGLITKRPRIAVAQAEKANPLYRAYKAGWAPLQPVTAGNTLASAIQIGNPVSFLRAQKALMNFHGVVEQATESELSNAAARADEEGAFCCPHTGVALAAVEKLTSQGVITQGSRVVVISTAHGLKFSEFKTGYHRKTLSEVEVLRANPPTEVRADLDAVKQVLDQRLG